jgi:hypothetical protein
VCGLGDVDNAEEIHLNLRTKFVEACIFDRADVEPGIVGEHVEPPKGFCRYAEGCAAACFFVPSSAASQSRSQSAVRIQAPMPPVRVQYSKDGQNPFPGDSLRPLQVISDLDRRAYSEERLNAIIVGTEKVAKAPLARKLAKTRLWVTKGGYRNKDLAQNQSHTRTCR